MEAHRARYAFAAFANVDEPLAAIGAQHGVARPIVIEGRPAQNERAAEVAAGGDERVLLLDRRPRLAREAVVCVRRFAVGRRRVVRQDIYAARLEEGAPVAHAGAALDERRLGGQHLERTLIRHTPRKKRRELAPTLLEIERRPELARGS